MKRDMDLIRKILLACEERERPDLDIEGYTEEQIGHHVYLMMEAGLLTGVEISTTNSKSTVAQPVELTWEGHDFLEASRNDTLWAKAKQAVGAGGGMSLDVLKAVLIGLAIAAAKKAAGLP